MTDRARTCSDCRPAAANARVSQREDPTETCDRQGRGFRHRNRLRSKLVTDRTKGRELVRAQGRIRTGRAERVLYLRREARGDGIAVPICVVGPCGLIEVRQDRGAPINGEVGIGTTRISGRIAADAMRRIAEEIQISYAGGEEAG